MKKRNLTYLAIVIAIMLGACGPKKELPSTRFTFDVSVDLDSSKSKAPALQSFAHAVNGNDWLLFAGRTNTQDSSYIGGLHDMNQNSDYAKKSFPPLSFNEDIFVYNVSNDQVWKLSYPSLKSFVQNSIKSSALTLEEGEIERIFELMGTAFRCSNPQIIQDETYLYLVGGYGTPLDSTDSASAYQTFNHVVRINYSKMIELVKTLGEGKELATSTEWLDLISVGSNDQLAATGGEIQRIADKLYLCGGHNYAFNNNKPGQKNGQKYQDAVYQFSVAQDGINPFKLNVSVGDIITDIPLDSIPTQYADKKSKLRRRDGPIVPILTTNGDGSIEQAISFYAGVFTPEFTAWNDAVYILPNTSSQLKIDSNYYQDNYNVYSCPDFGLFDPLDSTVHTFLPGGIGDSKNDSNLSAFTHSLAHIVLDTKEMTSSMTVNDSLFQTQYYYGAESSFMLEPGVEGKVFSLGSQNTELLDAGKLFGNDGGDIVVGYIYGGIEAFQKSPGGGNRHGYGKGLSAASSKIWKVTLSKKPIHL